MSGDRGFGDDPDAQAVAGKQFALDAVQSALENSVELDAVTLDGDTFSFQETAYGTNHSFTVD